MFDSCPSCGVPVALDSLYTVPCDGCFQFFHRICLNYRLIDVKWDDQPKAYAFCKECDDEG